DFGIMPKGFSCANDYLVFRSSIAKARKSPCDTLENSTSRRIWDESQQLKTGSRESSQNAGCADSDCKRKANRLPAAIHSIRIVERFAQVRPFSLSQVCGFRPWMKRPRKPTLSAILPRFWTISSLVAVLQSARNSHTLGRPLL